MSNLFVKASEVEELKFILYFDPSFPMIFSMDSENDIKEHLRRINLELTGEEEEEKKEEPQEEGKETQEKKATVGPIVKFKPECMHEIYLKFKKPNHAEITSLQSLSTSIQNRASVIDLYRYNDLRFRTFIRDWNLTDDDGNKSVINDENIDKINPGVYNEFILRMNIRIPLYL